MTNRMARIVLATFALAGSIAACGGDDDPAEIRYTATLSGANEVPARTTTASGTATITEDNTALNYTVNVAGITAVTAAHIHVGAAGVNGGVIAPLFGTTTPTGAMTGVLATGTITQSTITATNVSMDSLRVLLRNGNAYVNVHSSTYPGGELRGQVVRQN